MFSKKESQEQIVKRAALFGALEVLYIAFVALVIIATGGDSPIERISPVIGIITFLSFFVFSAGVSGLLIFGYPVYYLFQKKYQEAVISALVSLGTMFVLFFIVIGISLIFYR